MQLVDDDVQQQQQYWENLVVRVAAGDTTSIAEFRSTYRPGIRFLMQRRIGDAGAVDVIVDETIQGIVAEISAGTLTTVADMARYIRRAIPAAGRPAAGAPAVSEAAQERTSSRVRTLDEVLERFSSVEREALISFYARGFSERDVEAEFGYDTVAFRLLRERLVRSVNAARARRGPANVRRPAMMHTSAASGAA